MYAYLWNRLPGPTGARVALAALAVLAVVALLLFVVFPGVESLLPASDVTM